MSRSRITIPPPLAMPTLDPTGHSTRMTQDYNDRLRAYLEYLTPTQAHEATAGSDMMYWDDGVTSPPNGWCEVGNGAATFSRVAPPEGASGYGVQVVSGGNNNGIALPYPGRRMNVGEWYQLHYWVKLTAGQCDVEVVQVATDDTETILASRSHALADYANWNEIPGGQRDKPFGFRIEPGTAIPKRIDLRFTGTGTDTFAIAEVDVQKGRLEAPFVSVSRREDLLPGGAFNLTKPLKVPMGHPWTVDSAFDTVGFPIMGTHKGTRYAALENGEDQGVQFEFQLPFDWTFGANNRALRLVFTLCSPFNTSSVATTLKVHNKYLSSKDNESIDISTFGSTTTGEMDIDEDWTAYEMHTESHDVTSDSPDAAGTEAECSKAIVALVREGADASDTNGFDLWVLYEKCYAYWSLTDDVTNHFDTDLNHPLAIKGDYCGIVGT